MRRVIIESPHRPIGEHTAADTLRYLDAAIRDCLRRGETPYASHLMLTGALDDTDEAERAQGIEAGFAWRAAADATVVYTDLGISEGMRRGIQHAGREADRRIEMREGLPHIVEYRRLEGWAR